MKDKHRKKLASKEMKKPLTCFSELDISKASFVPEGMTRAYRNNIYTVMVYDKSPTTAGTAIRAMVQKHDDTPIYRHWSEMFKIKNEIFGEETTAIEFYPAVSNLIDRHNIYWMWIFETGQIPTPIL